MPLANGEVFAGYRILRLLGAGGMARSIWPSTQAAAPRRAEDSARRVVGEPGVPGTGSTAKPTWWPPVPPAHHRGPRPRRDRRQTLAVDGLHRRPRRRPADAGERFPGGLPGALVVEIVAAVSDALDYAHRQGLLHRDIKPANILLTGRHAGTRRILLADFGIARNVNETSGLTATNTVLGTVSYAAPEQLTGHQSRGRPRADQYALAATAYELLAGTTLFADPNPAVSDRPASQLRRRPRWAEDDLPPG